MKVYVKLNNNEYQGFIVTSTSLENTAKEWAGRNYEVVEFPNVFDVKPYGMEDRMNNKVFKVTTNVKNYETVTFDLYAKAVLDFIMCNGTTDNGWLHEMTSVERGEIVYSKGNIVKEYNERKKKQKEEYLTAKDLIVGECYISKNTPFIYLGKKDGKYYRLLHYGYIESVKSIKCYKCEDNKFTFKEYVQEIVDNIINNYHNEYDNERYKDYYRDRLKELNKWINIAEYGIKNIDNF